MPRPSNSPDDSRADLDSSDCRRRAGPTLGVDLTGKWLPTKQLTLRPSTWDTYRRNIELHVLPDLSRVPLRHLRAEHLERLYAILLESGRANGTGGLDTKTVLEVPMVLRRALTDAVRRELITRNPAEIAMLRSVVRSPPQQLSALLELAASHSLFAPAFTMATYQHVLPRMQAEAAPTFAASSIRLPGFTIRLPVPPGGTPGRTRRHAKRPWPEQRSDQDQLVAGAGFEPATFGL